MTYLSGLNFPGHQRDPQILCDDPNCATRIVITGLPPAWFLSGGPKRGWALIRSGDVRQDFCPLHKPAKAGAR